MRMNRWMGVVILALSVALEAQAAKPGGRARIGVRSATPYLGAIVVDARSGKVLFEDNADEQGYPASIVKLMDLLLIEERIASGALSLSNRVQVTAEAAKIGGSQVFLAEKEVFSVEDLLAATVIHSANDAAAALAIHVAGTRPAFVDLMNKRAAELGMGSTRFHSVHGLPPAQGQEPDVSTARDLALLAREVLKYPVTRYTSQQNRPFRNGTFGLRNPNHLLGTFPGCDGLKTGYFTAGGFSIVATAERDGRRAIAVVLGAADKHQRDAKAKELLSTGLLAAEPPPPPPPPVVTNAPPADPAAASSDEAAAPARNGRARLLLLGAAAVVVMVGVGVIRMRRLRAASER